MVIIIFTEKNQCPLCRTNSYEPYAYELYPSIKYLSLLIHNNHIDDNTVDFKPFSEELIDDNLVLGFQVILNPKCIVIIHEIEKPSKTYSAYKYDIAIN